MVKTPHTAACLAATALQPGVALPAALNAAPAAENAPPAALNALLGAPALVQDFEAERQMQLHAGKSQGQAHAKVILLGEHSVVYGHSAVALPLFDLGMRAHAWRTPDADARFESDYYTGSLLNAPEHMAAPRKAVEATLAQVGGSLQGLAVSVRGGIPLGRGLGSSAAAAGAIVEAVARLHGAELTDAERFALVQEAEKVAHGRPSGLDAYATTAAYPIRFRQGLATALATRLNAILIVADTGVHGSTKHAVELVRSLRERFRRKIDRVLEELGALAELAVDDLAQNRPHELGGRMCRAQELLGQLKVSHPSVDRLVAAARKAGALGAKLTGAGLGGCIITLTQPEKAEAIVQALKDAGATQVWKLNRWGAAA